MNRPVALLVACMLASCSDHIRGPGSVSSSAAGDSPPTPPEPIARDDRSSAAMLSPVVFIQPAHLLSQTGETPLRVYLDSSEPVRPEVLDELAAAIQLSERIGMTPVPFGVVKFNPSPYQAPLDNPVKGHVPRSPPRPSERAHVEIRPIAPLKAKWYVLSISKLPAGTRLPEPQSPAPLEGVACSVFHPSSSPVLARVTICKKAANVFRAAFHFSENVDYSSSSLSGFLSIEQPAGARTCTHLVSGSGSSPRFELDCPGFSEVDPWRIVMKAGLTSTARGGMVTTSSGSASANSIVNLASLSDWQPGCKEWQP